MEQPPASGILAMLPLPSFDKSDPVVVASCASECGSNVMGGASLLGCCPPEKAALIKRSAWFRLQVKSAVQELISHWRRTATENAVAGAEIISRTLESGFDVILTRYFHALIALNANNDWHPEVTECQGFDIPPSESPRFQSEGGSRSVAGLRDGEPSSEQEKPDSILSHCSSAAKDQSRSAPADSTAGGSLGTKSDRCSPEIEEVLQSPAMSDERERRMLLGVGQSVSNGSCALQVPAEFSIESVNARMKDRDEERRRSCTVARPGGIRTDQTCSDRSISQTAKDLSDVALISSLLRLQKSQMPAGFERAPANEFSLPDICARAPDCGNSPQSSGELPPHPLERSTSNSSGPPSHACDAVKMPPFSPSSQAFANFLLSSRYGGRAEGGSFVGPKPPNQPPPPPPPFPEFPSDRSPQYRASSSPSHSRSTHREGVALPARPARDQPSGDDNSRLVELVLSEFAKTQRDLTNLPNSMDAVRKQYFENRGEPTSSGSGRNAQLSQYESLGIQSTVSPAWNRHASQTGHPLGKPNPNSKTDPDFPRGDSPASSIPSTCGASMQVLGRGTEQPAWNNFVSDRTTSVGHFPNAHDGLREGDGESRLGTTSSPSRITLPDGLRMQATGSPFTPRQGPTVPMNIGGRYNPSARPRDPPQYLITPPSPPPSGCPESLSSVSPSGANGAATEHGPRHPQLISLLNAIVALNDRNSPPESPQVTDSRMAMNFFNALTSVGSSDSRPQTSLSAPITSRFLGDKSLYDAPQGSRGHYAGSVISSDSMVSQNMHHASEFGLGQSLMSPSGGPQGSLSLGISSPYGSAALMSPSESDLDPQRHQQMFRRIQDSSSPIGSLMANPPTLEFADSNKRNIVYSDDRDRMVYVSWVPKKARAYSAQEKRGMELDLKTKLRESIGLVGLTKVLLFPPKGVHCKLIFDCRESAREFMAKYGGDGGTDATERWKTDLCHVYEIDMHDKFEQTTVKIEWSQK